MSENYTQVVVARPSERGSLVDVWWIDSRLAKKHKRVRDEEGVVWTVAEVHGTRPRAVVEAWNGVHREFAETIQPF